MFESNFSYYSLDYSSIRSTPFIIFEQAIRRFSNWIRAVLCTFLTDILDLVYLRFA